MKQGNTENLQKTAAKWSVENSSCVKNGVDISKTSKGLSTSQRHEWPLFTTKGKGCLHLTKLKRSPSNNLSSFFFIFYSLLRKINQPKTFPNKGANASLVHRKCTEQQLFECGELHPTWPKYINLYELPQDKKKKV